MNDETKLMITGAYLWGALYAAGVFVAALVRGNFWAMIMILLSAGLAYICQTVSALGLMRGDRKIGNIAGLLQTFSATAAVMAGSLLIAGG